VCCSVLQCAAVYFCVLQRHAHLSRTCLRLSVLQCVAVCCSVLQCTAVCCSIFLCVAVTRASQQDVFAPLPFIWRWNHTGTEGGERTYDEFLVGRRGWEELETACEVSMRAGATGSDWRTATRCNSLQHTATHCRILQHAAAHCNTLPYTATRCSTLQHTAMYCNTLQHTAAHCSTLQRTTTYVLYTIAMHTHTSMYCNTLQHTAKHSATCCNML